MPAISKRYSAKPRARKAFFNQKRAHIPSDVVRTFIGRHEIKEGGTPTGLSIEGEKRARAALIKAEQTGRKVRVTTSTNPRTFHTGRLNVEGYLIAGGNANRGTREEPAKRGRVLKAMSLDSILEPKQLDYYMAQVERIKKGNPKLNDTQAEEHLLVEWMKGKHTKKLGKAHQITDNIIWHTLGPALEAAQKGHKNLDLRNITHSGFVEMVFMRLTGRDFRSTGKGMVDFGEGMTVHFVPKEKTTRAILEYRGKQFDVTRNLNRILDETRSGFK